MEVQNGEIVKVLDAVLAYLNITLPNQELSPDAEMGRESLANRVQSLADKLNANSSKPTEIPNEVPAVEEELYDDVAGATAGDKNEPAPANRQSCYMDMTQPGAVGDDTMDGNAPTDELAQDEEYEIPAAENHIKKNTDGIKQSDALIQDEEYEVPANEVVKSEVTELLEEDEPEEYDDITNQNGEMEEVYDDVSNTNGNDDSQFELTDDALLLKLKGLENTNPKNILGGSLFSGWLLKQKKKFMSKWHKRYCILKEQFLFYYQSETDSKALGVVVLPGYKLCEEKSNGKEKLTFKLVATGKGRSTYSFQVKSKNEYNAWMSVISPICSQKLSRLSSDAFNRVAKKMDAESEEGSAGEAIKAKEPAIAEEGGDMYEFVPEDGLASTQNQVGVHVEEEYDDLVDGKIEQMNQQQGEQEDLYECIEPNQPSSIPPRPTLGHLPPPLPSSTMSQRTPTLPERNAKPADTNEELYDDHIDRKDDMVQKSAAVPAEELYEGIPGEDYQPEASQNTPVQEDLYEDIAPFQQGISNVPTTIPPRPPTSAPPPMNPVPSLPAQGPAIPERRPMQGTKDDQAPPLPPSIPSRGDRGKETETAPVTEDKPSEDDFSYENVYIGKETYSAKETDELAFDRGDLIYILQKVNTNWWIGCMDKKVGLVPSNLLTAGFAH